MTDAAERLAIVTLNLDLAADVMLGLALLVQRESQEAANDTSREVA